MLYRPMYRTVSWLLGSALFMATVAAVAQEGVVITPEKELVISDLSVIEARAETTFDPSRPSGTSRRGTWSFGRLIHNMLPEVERDSARAASRLVLEWLNTWEADLAANPAVSPAVARPAIRLLITNPWKAASGCVSPESPATDADCVLAMSKAPFKLLAIVNRPDLRVVADDGSAIAGEGRFVFQVLGPTIGVDGVTGRPAVMSAEVKPQKFTVIFEYSLPVARAADIIVWAKRWHDLGLQPFGDEFNSTLRAITNDFAGADKDLRRINGSALNQVRTNEVALAGARFPIAGFSAARQVWELREFRLTAAGLTPQPVHLEPSRDFDIPRAAQTAGEGLRTATLVDWLNANATAVLASTHRLPAEMTGNSALVGSAPYGAWGKLVNPNPPTIPSQGMAHDLGDLSIPVRDAFAVNTCAGCHRHETDTRHFMHITALAAMEPAGNVDDRARVGIIPGTPENTVVLSNFLKREIVAGGARSNDFAQVLTTTASALRNRAGMRVCGR